MYSSSLFHAADHERLVARINTLTPASQAQWGTMNVAQMLAHCQVPLRIALGDMKPASTLLNRLVGRMLKGMILRRPEFRKNSPTFKEAVIADERSFEQEHANLLGLVRRLAEGGTAAITTDPHPFFGKLTPEEWDNLQSKHLDHHLRQFGV
jgi:hypothetical protein